MSEILFGQAYYLRFDPKLWEARQPYPPLGTLYAASYIRQRGYEVALFDAMLAESEQEWDQELDRHKPRLAVLYEDNFNYLSKMCLLRMRQAAFEMIEMARLRGCTVIVGGADASDNAEMYLRKGADFVLLGEGEITLGELVDYLFGKNHISLESIAGLAYQATPRAETSPTEPIYIRNARRKDIADLDSLPFPAWDLVDVSRYRNIWMQSHGYFSMNMVTTRGCPFHCNWCAKPIWGQRYHARSPENVVTELQWLKDTYQPDHIWFVDDILGLKPGWLEQFAELVEKQRIGIPFKCLNRADLLLREGEIDALRRAGCQIVWIGAESGSQTVLDAMEKGIQTSQIIQAARGLQEAGIEVGFFLQFGYPGESFKDIQSTLQLVREGNPDDIGMSVSYPLPGTRFYEAVRLQIGPQQNWIDSNDLAMLYRGPYSTRFYRQLHTVLHKEFRRQKAWHQLAGSRNNHRPQGDKILGVPRASRNPLALWLFNTLTLPVAWGKLHWLRHSPHRGIGSLPPGMSLEGAALPSDQSD